MAKLIVAALVLAFVAFATAHTTTILTTIEDDYPLWRQQQCSPQLRGQNLNQCRMYIMKQGENPQQCCQQLENVEEECQCEAVKQVFRDAVQQVQQQQGQQHQIRRPFSSASQQIQRFQTRAQQLKNQCNIPRQCSIGSVTTTIGPNPFWWPFGSDEEECSRTKIQRPVNQCRRYVEEQVYSSSPRTLLAQSFDREGQQECCRALKNLNRNCQCEAIENLARKVMRELPQQGGGHQSGDFGGSQVQGGSGGDQEGKFGGSQEQGGSGGDQEGKFGGSQQQGGQERERMEMARRVIQNLPDQCNLDVQQCNIPF